jgi:hypothetical protein
VRHSIQLLEKEQVILATLYGQASKEGLSNFVADMLKPPYVGTKLPVLSDLRGLDARELHGEDIRSIVELVGNHREQLAPVRHAFVVGDATTYGFARMYELMAEGPDPQDFNVFYDYHEARAWLEEN